jgi:L-2-hydroxycarboxylate dehydrogenase (NAD+)
MSETIYLRHGRLHYFVREVLKRLRVPAPQASRVGDALVAADLAGFESEGVSRLPHFATRISAGLIKANPDIQITQEDQATATIDGDNGMGHVVAIRSMEHALTLAKKFGVAAVAAKRSNDLGMAGYYARLALKEQMIGVVMSNATPTMLPPHGTRPMLGSNPLAIAIPAAEDEPPFVLDMATTGTSRNRLTEAARRGEAIPTGLALDDSGSPTVDPGSALEAMRLLPLGVSPERGSYKGYGLSLAIDILSGVLSGGNFGRHLSGSENTHEVVAGIGHFVIAIRLRAFSPWIRFRNHIKDMMRELTATPAEGAPRVYYPGEAELAIEQERRATGIPVEEDVAERLEGLARRLDIHDAWEHLVEGRK